MQTLVQTKNELKKHIKNEEGCLDFSHRHVQGMTHVMAEGSIHSFRFSMESYEPKRRVRWYYADPPQRKLRNRKNTSYSIRDSILNLEQLKGSLPEKQFNYLANKWKRETAGYSTSYHITKHEAYLDIIGMGKQEPDYWFVALKHIVKPKVDPIPNEHYGDLEKMTEDWLNWGRENNIL
jgi:hypothetical protein